MTDLVGAGAFTQTGYGSLAPFNANGRTTMVGTAALQVPLAAAASMSMVGHAALTTAIRLVGAGSAPMVGQASLYGGFYNAFGTMSMTGAASLWSGFMVAPGAMSMIGAANLTTGIRLAANGSLNMRGVAYLNGTLTPLGPAPGNMSMVGSAWLYVPNPGTADVLSARIVAEAKHQRVLANPLPQNFIATRI